jgi:FlaA1/EpsC-like NDP-sugar epimerase
VSVDGRKDLTKGKVMIIGATGSIGSVCSRLLAQAISTWCWSRSSRRS